MMENTIETMNLMVEYSATEAGLKKIEADYSIGKMPIDLTILENYGIIKGAVTVCRKMRSVLEAERKAQKLPALTFGRKVDAAANVIKERILAVETPLAGRKDIHDTLIEVQRREILAKEERRTTAINLKINVIKGLAVDCILATSDEINKKITELKSCKPQEWADEFEDSAKVTISNTLEKLEELYSLRFNAEMMEETVKAQKLKEAMEQETVQLKNVEMMEETVKAQKLKEAMAQETVQLKNVEMMEETVKAGNHHKNLSKEDAIQAMQGILDKDSSAENVINSIIKGDVPSVVWVNC